MIDSVRLSPPRARWSLVLAAVVVLLLAACKPSAEQQINHPVAQDQAAANQSGAGDSPNRGPERIEMKMAMPWGGQVRCTAPGQCRLAVVEHKDNTVAVFEINGRQAKRAATRDTKHHPDSAIWLTDDVLAAAVELAHGVDLYRFGGQDLEYLTNLGSGVPPRDVLLLNPEEVVAKGDQAVFRLLAVPYGGTLVTWSDWRMGHDRPDRAVQSDWCQAPWHPVLVPHAPEHAESGIAVGCLDDKRVMWLPVESSDSAQPVELAHFDHIPRNVAPSPSGQWLYVALELGGFNARINMKTGEVQKLDNTPNGSVGVAPLAEDLVAWGDSKRLMLQKYDDDGGVLETRWLPTNGFTDQLQVIDVDGDGALDLVVLHSTGDNGEIIFGPLWDQAGSEELPRR